MALFVALTFWVVVVLVPEPEYPIYRMTDHWDATLADGTLQKDVKLIDVEFGSVHTGEVYELRHVLPAVEVRAGTLQMKTRHCTLEVYVDDQIIYFDGNQYVEAGDMTPAAFHFVPLPEGYAGKILTLHIQPNEDDAFGSLEPILVGNISDLENEYLRSGRLTLFTGLFLCVMGVILFFIFIYLSVNYRTESRIFFSGLISLQVGLYILSYYSLTELLSPGDYVNNMIEYITLFFLPFSFMALVSSTNEHGGKKIYAAISAINFLIAAATVVLHVRKIAFIDSFVSVVHLMILVEGLGIVLFTAIGAIIRRRRAIIREEWRVSQIIWAGGFFALLFAAIIDIIRYNIERYLTSGESYSNLNVLTIGALLFISALIVNFFYYHIEQLYEEATIHRLSGLAYTDPLTDMSNRSRCEQLMRRMDDEGEPFIVISMDLDHLKEINDTYGHSEGDRYLSDMAKLLRQSFLDTSLLGRMGGDEFIAIWKGTDYTPCLRSIARMETALINRHYTHPPVRGDISYGYACSTETYSGNIKDTFHLADTRMYEMKSQRHRQEAAHA